MISDQAIAAVRDLADRAIAAEQERDELLDLLEQVAGGATDAQPVDGLTSALLPTGVMTEIRRRVHT